MNAPLHNFNAFDLESVSRVTESDGVSKVSETTQAGVAESSIMPEPEPEKIIQIAVAVARPEPIAEKVQTSVEEVTDEQFVEAAHHLLRSGKTRPQIKATLFEEFEGFEQDADQLIDQAYEKEIEDALESEGLSQRMATEAGLKAVELQDENDRLVVHNYQLAGRLGKDFDTADKHRAAQILKSLEEQKRERELEWLDLSESAARPAFPEWVMHGTSLYEKLAKPVSDVNSKLPELIWLPAAQLMLNYLYGKVGIKGMRTHTNMFLGIISSPGKFFKSSSCKLAHEHFGRMGLMKNLAPGLTNSEGKIVIGQAGSSEGFGLHMFDAKAKHGIMFNGELGKLVSKAGIENSSLPHDLLLWYESEDFANTIKSKRQNFTFPAGSYCFGWQFCTTIRGFNNQWPRIAGIASGMQDRFFFLVTPEEPKQLKDEVYVNTVEGSIETMKLINKAMTGYNASIDGTTKVHEYEIDQDAADRLRTEAAAFGDPRSMNMVYKFALYFAIDLGLDSITEDCIDRALALVEYRQRAIAFLQPIEARNDEGRLLQEMLRELRQSGGRMTRRDFAKNLNAGYYGDRFWSTVYYGALKADRFREFTEPGGRGQTRKMIGLVKDDVRFGPE